MYMRGEVVCEESREECMEVEQSVLRTDLQVAFWPAQSLSLVTALYLLNNAKRGWQAKRTVLCTSTKADEQFRSTTKNLAGTRNSNARWSTDIPLQGAPVTTGQSQHFIT